MEIDKNLLKRFLDRTLSNDGLRINRSNLGYLVDTDMYCLSLSKYNDHMVLTVHAFCEVEHISTSRGNKDVEPILQDFYNELEKRLEEDPSLQL